METKSIGQGVAPAKAETSRSKEVEGEKRKVEVRPVVGDRSARAGYDVSLSKEARELLKNKEKALEIAKNTPDVREAKVAELKNQIKSGKYQIKPDQIADSMLREAVREELANRADSEDPAV